MSLRKSIGIGVTVVATAGFLVLAASAEAGTIKKRAGNQQDRVAQGVKSGQLTAGETARIENKEAHLNQEVHDMRVVDGGKLSAADKAAVNQQQNKLSRNIYKQKHDGQTQPN
jgi:hypothetical protein